MEHFDLGTTAAQDALAVEIHTLAHLHAKRVVPNRDDRDDAAQDVVLDCLIEIRAQTFSTGKRTLSEYIKCLVGRRAIVIRRDRGRAMLRDNEHVRDREGAVRFWMEPELYRDSEELEEKYTAVLKMLTPACVRAYALVRGERLSYAEAAERLGVGRNTVKAHVVHAQREFQKAFGKRKGKRGWIAYEPGPAKAKVRRRKRGAGSEGETAEPLLLG